MLKVNDRDFLYQKRYNFYELKVISLYIFVS